ncbi:hypothetical protein AAA799B03_00363 [Marine Group I thaumarchaeote SCGC AAA799-B03]|uniref:Uncharacterized protein n=3 Tax=Marine Group I TaxID=905826 RepID=A0A087S8H1_9ARCH|nr:hypothetical protein AAA799N04_00385 [Marine Group I thaumarchaeote SCGC AAA799-N04]KFM18051.1 hypothetical protein SCCGRSA3_01405 [Marine Group I thaumarchaeote SCGC RSA3]KFM22025.1 hypothetical protein AAA799B03_00363 [Marine Group I thaumarchaeote SCGC AAA799-B03]
MFEEIVNNLVLIKQDFAKNYSGNAHIQEVVPASSSKKFPLDEKHLKLLHKFAEKNPIYSNSYEEKILETNCVIYEGDINDYWLNSIKHGTSCQPFYPTWIISAYLMTLIAKELGYRELVDIGSGDGRIAFCGNVLGFTSHSIEIDDGLVELQKLICNETQQNFDRHCEDALEYDYSKFKLKHPVFFIGGLPQMGGDMLATSIIEKINSLDQLRNSAGIVFAGTHSKRHLSGNLKDGGWSSLIQNHDLQVIETVSLPAIWTFDQTTDTPYIYTKFN